MDRREAILERLVAIAAAVPGITEVKRNVPPELAGIDSQANPQPSRIIIFDGDEKANEDDPTARPANAPRIVHLESSLLIQMGNAPENIGSVLNAARAALYKAIVNDATLLSLVINGRAIRYLGAASDLAWGHTVVGLINLSFRFSYILNPSDL